MKRKTRKITNIIFLISIFIFVCIGLVKINIINTKALSPVGNSNDNYQLVNEEFGEDFSKFIKDNAQIKIYINANNNGEILIKVGDKDLKIKDESFLISGTRNIFNGVYDLFGGIKEYIGAWTGK